MKKVPCSPIRRLLPKRLLLAAGLTLGVLAPAAFGASTAAADPTPPRLSGGTLNVAPISAIQVQPGGLAATVSFTTAEPTTVSIDHKAVTATTTGRQPTVQVPTGTFHGVTSPTATQPTPVKIFDGQFHATRTYATTHDLKLTGLRSNTAYDVVVTAETRAGQKLTAQTHFTTLKQRVRLTLDKIVVHNDGDDGLIFSSGDGEPLWGWQVEGVAHNPFVKDCFPKVAGQCQEGSFGEGAIVPTCTRGERDHRACPYSYIFAEENFQPIAVPTPQPGSEDFTSMPRRLRLYSHARESDGSGILNCLWDGCEFGGGGFLEWQVPVAVESATESVTLKADDIASSPDFKSTMYFTFQLFYDNQSYPPNAGRVSSTSQ